MTVALSTPGRLNAPAAAAFERARFALWLADVNSGTTDAMQALRSEADQARIFLERYEPQPNRAIRGPYGDARIWNGVRYVRTSGLGAAAIPGTSNHGDGATVDWQNLGPYDSDTWNRAAVILAGHGWSNREGRIVGEPWHWTYTAADDNHKGETVDEYIDKIASAVAVKINNSITSARAKSAAQRALAAVEIGKSNAKALDAVAAQLAAATGTTVTTSAEALAIAVEKRLADDFAKIPDAVADESAARLAN